MRIGLIEEDVWVTRDQMGRHVEEQYDDKEEPYIDGCDNALSWLIT